MTNLLRQIYLAALSVPSLVLVLIVVGVVAAALHVPKLSFNASTTDLIAENDPALASYQAAVAQFGGDEFIVLTYEPTGESLFARSTLTEIEEIQRRVADLPGVASVTSILDAPLLQSPPVALSDLAEGFNTLRDPTADLEMARTELTESPLYRELLVSADGNAAAMRIQLVPATALQELTEELGARKALGSSDQQMIRHLEESVRVARNENAAEMATLIAQLRSIEADFSDGAIVHVSGVPAIATDMARYAQRDTIIFGVTAIVLVFVCLSFFFGHWRWAAMCLSTALLGVLFSLALVALLGRPLTVISGSFVSLIIIFSTGFSVHLVVRFRELSIHASKGKDTRALTDQTMVDKFAPCLFTALTTSAAFAALLLSDVLPIREFGLIMCLAIAITFVLNVTFFPAALKRFGGAPARTPHSVAKRPAISRSLLWMGRKISWGVVTLAVLGVAASVYGAQKLSWDSRLIDYFRDGTDVKASLAYIDERFGGTTSIDILINFVPYEEVEVTDDFFTDTTDTYPQRYWYTDDKVAVARQIGEALAQRPEVGKIISIATLDAVAQTFNDGQPLNSLQLAGVVGQLPPSLREELLAPFASPEAGLLRISLRIQETEPGFDRNDLIAAIYDEATELGLTPSDVTVTGVGVLFGNMLESLVRSQLTTFLGVFVLTFSLFLILLRSFRIAVIGIIPNIVAVAAFLGAMGYFGIVFDLMTVTITSIVVGIGVDNAIHYLHRYRLERRGGTPKADAVRAAQDNVGRALFITTLTTAIGFSVLLASTFTPTLYFGSLMGAALLASLAINLTLLPALIHALDK
ncbi:MMPL family transporter [Maricaulaceae bacterium NA33B04]|nr:MMPL family transporter [Maricaulaceae bacterium NA33B04]